MTLANPSAQSRTATRVTKEHSLLCKIGFNYAFHVPNPRCAWVCDLSRSWKFGSARCLEKFVWGWIWLALVSRMLESVAWIDWRVQFFLVIILLYQGLGCTYVHFLDQDQMTIAYLSIYIYTYIYICTILNMHVKIIEIIKHQNTRLASPAKKNASSASHHGIWRHICGYIMIFLTFYLTFYLTSILTVYLAFYI